MHSDRQIYNIHIFRFHRLVELEKEGAKDERKSPRAIPIKLSTRSVTLPEIERKWENRKSASADQNESCEVDDLPTFLRPVFRAYAIKQSISCQPMVEKKNKFSNVSFHAGCGHFFSSGCSRNCHRV